MHVVAYESIQEMPRNECYHLLSPLAQVVLLHVIVHKSSKHKTGALSGLKDQDSVRGFPNRRIRRLLDANRWSALEADAIDGPCERR